MRLTLLLLGTALTYGFPRDKTVTNTNTTKVVSSSYKIKPDQKTKFHNSEDVIIYHENRDDGILKCLCWAEIFVITENNINKEINLTNEFSIILESPGDITKENAPQREVDVYTILDTETKKNRTLKFTVVNKTDEFTIKQHKIVHCGAGPILIKTYIEWPKQNKQKIEIRLLPTSPSKWQIHDSSLNYGVQITSPPNVRTFDTTSTESYSYTDLDDVTPSISATETVEETFNRKWETSNENVGSKLDDKAFQNPQKKESVLKPYDVNANTDKSGFSNSAMKRELLSRNMYFKKLSEAEKSLSISDSTFFDDFEYDIALYFFDLIYPNKTCLWTSGRHHKFIINIQVSIEHIAIEHLNGTEVEEELSEMVMEEKNVYRFKQN